MSEVDAYQVPFFENIAPGGMAGYEDLETMAAKKYGGLRATVVNQLKREGITGFETNLTLESRHFFDQLTDAAVPEPEDAKKRGFYRVGMELGAFIGQQILEADELEASIERLRDPSAPFSVNKFMANIPTLYVSKRRNLSHVVTEVAGYLANSENRWRYYIAACLGVMAVEEAHYARFADAQAAAISDLMGEDFCVDDFLARPDVEE